MTKTIVVLVVSLLFALPALAQTSTPQPVPLPAQEMYQQLATANANVASMPADLTRPEGLPLLTNESGREMFGYVKWLTSPATADEWAGPFAPIFTHIGIGLAGVFVLMGVYATVYVSVNIVAWVSWLLEQARRILDLLLQATQAAPFIIVLAVILLIAGILYSIPVVKGWVDSELNGVLENVIDFANVIISRLMEGT